MTPEREALEALATIEQQMMEMRSLKGWRMNIIREQLEKAKSALSAAPGEPCAVKPIGYVSQTGLDRLREWFNDADSVGVVGEPRFARTIPLYTALQPAAGWDEAIEAAAKVARLKYAGSNLHSIGNNISDDIFSLRREAPAPADLSYIGQLIAENNELKDQLAARPDTAESRLREALTDARAAIATVAAHEFGFAEVEYTDGPGLDYQYPIRDELLAKIDAALSPPSGGDEAKESAPDFKAAQNNAESDPSVTPDCSGADTAPPADRREIVVLDEDHPDCTTDRERELYDALMGLSSAVMVRGREWVNWYQGGVHIAPLVKRALRLDGGR